MDELGSHHYILSFLDELHGEQYLRSELTYVVLGFTQETADQVASILRTVYESHLPLTPEMIVTCIIGGP